MATEFSSDNYNPNSYPLSDQRGTPTFKDPSYPSHSGFYPLTTGPYPTGGSCLIQFLQTTSTVPTNLSQLYGSPLQNMSGSPETTACADKWPVSELYSEADGTFSPDVSDRMIGSPYGAPIWGGEGRAQEERQLREGENEDDEGEGESRLEKTGTVRRRGRKPSTSKLTSVCTYALGVN